MCLLLDLDVYLLTLLTAHVDFRDHFVDLDLLRHEFKAVFGSR